MKSNTYTVMRDDTIALIAYKNNMTISELVKLNPTLNKELLYLGQTLNIR